MATEPPTPPHPGSPDPNGPDAGAPTPPAVSFDKGPADERPADERPADERPADRTAPEAPPAPPASTAPEQPAPSDAVPPAPADAVPPAPEGPGPAASGQAVPPAAPVPASPGARDVWAPPEPGGVPAAAPPLPGPHPAPPVGGFGPPVPPGGPHGAGPYPYGTPAPFGPLAPQKPSYNGLAVTALVLGLVCCVPLIGVILGVIALAQIRKNGQRGKGLAIAGIALSAVGTLMAVLFFTAGGWEAFKAGFEEGAREANATASLQPGDCFDEPGAPDAATDEARLVGEIEEVSCDAPHDGEVFARFDLPDAAYPGETDVIDEADRRCLAQLSRYTMDAWRLAQEADYSYYYPAKGNWSFGDRSVVCVLTPLDGRSTGSLRLDETVLEAEQLAYLEPVAGLDSALARAPFAGVDEDLAAHQEWAGEVAGELSAVSEALRAHDWDAEAAPLAERLAGEVDDARAVWEKLPDAEDGGAFRIGWAEAHFALTDGTGGAEDLRKALGLSTERPTSDSSSATPAGAL